MMATQATGMDEPRARGPGRARTLRLRQEAPTAVLAWLAGEYGFETAWPNRKSTGTTQLPEIAFNGSES
jgi:hypothetical protein